jgi:hypothetical protein
LHQKGSILWLQKLKSEFKGQILSKFDLGLLNAYKLMYFDGNIDGNKDEKSLGGDDM